MNNYKRGDTIDLGVDLSGFSELQNASHITVTPTSKIWPSVLKALTILKEDDKVVWIGSGSAADKAVSCAEVMKKKKHLLHQITRITYKKVEEQWDPIIEDLDQLKVLREIPTVAIILSIHPLDCTIPGYQGPLSSSDELYTGSSQPRRKRNLNNWHWAKNQNPNPNPNQRYKNVNHRDNKETIKSFEENRQSNGNNNNNKVGNYVQRNKNRNGKIISRHNDDGSRIENGDPSIVSEN